MTDILTSPKSVQRCTQCILPSSYPGIRFNDDQVCSFCQAPAPVKPTRQAQQELEGFIAEAVKSNARYQAIVPVSGGKDSAYVLYMMRHVYGLRVLALNFDNGFRTPSAAQNLDLMTRRLGVDLISLKPSWELMKRLYGAFIKDTGEFCSVCNAVGYLTLLSHTMQELPYLGTAKLLLVGGWSEALEAMPGMYSFDTRYFYEVIEKAGLADELRRSPLINELALDFLLNQGDPRQDAMARDLPVLFFMLPNYVEWNHATISETLQREVGWRVPPESEHETHFDCEMYPVAKYLEARKYGFSQSTVTHAALVRTGQITRDEALKRIEIDGAKPPPELDEFLRRLDVQESEVNYDGLWHPQRTTS